jgi:hypothetical protein
MNNCDVFKSLWSLLGVPTVITWSNCKNPMYTAHYSIIRVVHMT